jgi:DNA polymerase-3 subunit alpha
MKTKFVEGAMQKGSDKKTLEKIWADWEAFAQYAFNKSHSTCYALVAYQTAYLKAHYPSEYMAAVLSNNLSNLDKITFYMEEARRMGIPVLGPDINESNVKFSVNQKGQIRYALSAIKGVGEAAVESIIEERKLNGPFKSVFEFATRVNLRTVNKKSLENLAYAGAFDSFEKYTRAQFIVPDPKDGLNLVEKIVRYGNSEQSAKTMNQSSLFGDMGSTKSLEPIVSPMEEWPLLEKLKKEKEVIGIYISGHPLDDYKLEMTNFTNCTLSEIKDRKDTELRIGGIITSSNTRISKTGNQFVVFHLEDFDGIFEFALFGKDYIQFKNFAETPGAMIFIVGRYQPRYNQPDNYEFKTSKIELLSDIREKLAKSISIRVKSENLTDRITNELVSVFKQFPGKLPVNFLITNDMEEIALNVFSRKYSVSPANELFQALAEIEEVKAKVN